MPKDVIITPASGLVDFQGNTGISSATIQLDNSGNLSISNPSGDLTLGDTSRDIFIGDGVNNVDIVFEQDGEIRALTNKTISLGQADSYIRFAGQLLGEIDITQGPLLVGAATSTGTASQALQVNSGAYVSGNLGVGTTNPTSKLTVTGDVRASGIVTASQLVSTVATGTAPLTVSSTTLVSNLNADLFDDVDSITRSASHRANRNISGGGTITDDVSGNVLWSSRFIIISNGSGSNFAASGYFDIACPLSGTITGVGGASNVTATSAGIPLGAWQAIYYILPIGSANTSLAANFRVAQYTSALDIPHNWVLICVRNGDNNSVTFNNGITLTAGQSMSSVMQSNANTANTLVRRDGSGNFSAGTITATTFSGSGASLTSIPNSATTATSANTASAIVARDASGNFSAGTITASLTGNSSTTSGCTFSNDAVNKADITTRTDSGFYEHDTATTAEGWPITSNNWMHMIACTHSNDANYYSMQIAASFFNNTDLYYRSTNASGTTAWSKIWNSSNDGTGSGLDADLLDGYQSATANTINTIVLRDGSGNFSAGTITATSFSGSGASLTSLNASNLGSGTVPVLRLGDSGTRNATTFLRGDNTWATAGDSITVSDDTTTNATRYLIFEDVTSGSSTSINVSSTKLTFNPSTGTLSATQFTSLSDVNKKKNIRPIENAIDITKKLEGVRFDWIDNDTPSIGVIAQEVEKVLPELVVENDGIKSVSYGNIVGVLIEAIKEQQVRIEELERKLNA